MNDKTRPALVGGLIAGLLSAIPFVNMVNTCCCAWIVAGGALAAYLYIKNSPTRVPPADAAQVGLFTGIVAAIVLIVVGVPLGLLFSSSMNEMMVKVFEGLSPQAGEEMRRQVELQQNQPLSQRLAQMFGFSIMNAVVTIIFATLGGLLGMALFEKRRNEPGSTTATPPPPPPTAFGGPTTPFQQ
jgi:peptidoglycan/LPS O-acetylase OafA/YrhL